MYKVYLAGYITGSVIEQCIEWRKKIREHYAMQDWDIIFLDPLNGKYINTISEDGLKSNVPAHAIIHRDFQSVTKSDLIVVNTDTFGGERPLTGTICELAWAWEHHIPIVMISNEEKYSEHPFLDYFASWKCKTVDELLEKKIINYFYKGQHSAIY